MPRESAELGAGPNEPVSASARPLVGNRFDPARIYAARSTGVVTVYAFFDKGDRRSPGLGLRRLGDRLHPDERPRGHRRGRSGQDDRGEQGVHRVQGRDRPGRDRRLGRLRRRRPPARRPDAHALAPVPLGDSSRVRAGDPVAAMGSPFGNEDSIAVGVVSAVRRSIMSLTSVYKVVDAIQIDAPITHGNSGGPLFDARGA